MCGRFFVLEADELDRLVVQHDVSRRIIQALYSPSMKRLIALIVGGLLCASPLVAQAPQKAAPAAAAPVDATVYAVSYVEGIVSTPAQNGRAIVMIAHVDVTTGPQPPIMLRRLADASRQEPGNVRFDVMQHTMRANHFTVIETWRDQKAFDEHLAAAHTKQYRDEV